MQTGFDHKILGTRRLKDIKKRISFGFRSAESLPLARFLKGAILQQMADIWSTGKRSEVMSLIRSRGNKSTELRIIGIFRRFGIRGWRRGQCLVGKPDFTFRRERVVVFVDGCFWHGCPTCRRHPFSNQDYWGGKFARNRARDAMVTADLQCKGWHVIRVWEHQLRDEQGVAREILAALADGGKAEQSALKLT